MLSTDASEDMVNSAAANAEKAGLSIAAQTADLMALPFKDNSFDAATCCYGYMFAADKHRALEETFRVLKLGAPLVATTWDNVVGMDLVRDIMTDVLGAEPPTPDLNPLALAEPDLFESEYTIPRKCVSSGWSVM